MYQFHATGQNAIDAAGNARSGVRPHIYPRWLLRGALSQRFN